MNTVKWQGTKSSHENLQHVVFLHANNELVEREIKKTIPFTITTKITKINSNKFNQRNEGLVH